MNANYPADILLYFRAHPGKFEVKSKAPLKILYLVVSILCVLLIAKPKLLIGGYQPEWLVRTIAAVVLIVAGLSSLFGRTTYYNNESGGKITGPAIKNFNLEQYPEDEIIEMFNTKQFDKLLNISSRKELIYKDKALLLSIFEDPIGEEFYVQIRKHSLTGDLRGATDVVTIGLPQYKQLKAKLSTSHKYIKS